MRRTFLVAFGLFLTLIAAPTAQPERRIYTVAGNGLSFETIDEAVPGVFTNVSPVALALDEVTGDIYFNDAGTRVRRLDAAGYVTTIAGTGLRTTSLDDLGDGGPALQATLGLVWGISLARHGSDLFIYIADVFNCRVRRISPDGIIQTVAGSGPAPCTDGSTIPAVEPAQQGDGGPATSARIALPYNVHVSTADGADTIYFSDAYHHRVRRVLPTGIVETFAGTGTPTGDGAPLGDGGPATQATFNLPAFMALRDGAVYVGDVGNYRIRRIDATGVITTVAGNGDAAPAADGAVATDAGLGAAYGLEVAADGSIYFGQVATMFPAEPEANRVRRIGPDGIVTTVAGVGGPSGSTTGDKGPALAANLQFPSDVRVKSNGDVYIADYTRIRVVSDPPTASSNREPFADAGDDISKRANESFTVDGTGSIDIDGEIVDFEWEFSDGTVVVGASASHAFADIGTHSATLTVTDAFGKTAQDVVEITVRPHQGPAAVAGSDLSVRLGQPAAFDGSGSSAGDAAISSYDWTFGDGASATGAVASHAYNATGSYTVTLTVTDEVGATASDSLIVTVDPALPPSADAGPDVSGIAGQPTWLIGSATAGDFPVTAHEWDFGDGTSAGGAAVSHVYAAPGTYTATLTVTDANGATATDTASVSVRAHVPPTANAGPDVTVSINHMVMLSGLASTGGDSTIARHEWRLPDNTTQASALALQRQSALGTFTATLTVTDAVGATDSDTVEITVTPPPDPDRVIQTLVLAAAIRAVAVDDATGAVYFVDGHRVRRFDPTGTLTTVAGNFAAGDSGDGGPATAALLREPGGVAVARDAGGLHLYISDTQNHRVRRVRPDGIIETVAGAGSPAFGGDGGAATAASLWAPIGIAVSTDGSGNHTVFVADNGNRRLRRIHGGVIETIAGDGTTATLNDPYGVAVNQQSGAVYVTERFAHRLRVWLDGALQTVASASLALPTGVAVGADGAVYVAEELDHRIRRIDADGTARTVAGTNMSGFEGDGGPATAALLNQPHGVAVRAGGDLYIADTFNNRLRRVYEPGTVGSNFAPVANAGADFSAEAHEAASFDAAGSFDVGDTIVSYQWDFGDGATGAGIAVTHTYQAIGVYVATLTVTDSFGASATDTVTVTVQQSPPPPNLDRRITTLNSVGDPRGVAADNVLGFVFVAASSHHVIQRYFGGMYQFQIGTGEQGFRDAHLSSAAFNLPLGVAAITVPGSPNQTFMYVADRENSRIRLETQGLVRTAAGTGTIDEIGRVHPIFGFNGDGSAANVTLNRPEDVAVIRNAAGQLVVYIADTGNHRIRRLQDGMVTTIAGNGSAAFSGDGGLATDAGVPGPRSVAVGPDGSVYVSDASDRIRRIAGDGVITTIAGSGLPAFDGDGGPAITKGMNPQGLAVDHDGYVYFADAANHRVRAVSPLGVLETFAGDGTPGFGGDSGAAFTARLNTPLDVALSHNGNLYVADTGNAAVRVIDLLGVIWNPGAITYGTPYSAVQNATSAVPGTFEYFFPASHVFPAGTRQVSVTFRPSDSSLSPRQVIRFLTVNRKPLDVRAAAVEREFGLPNELPCTLEGVVNNDPITASCTTEATPLSPPGAYAITASLHDPLERLANYSVTTSHGTLTVRPAVVTVTVHGAIREYGLGNDGLTGTIIGTLQPGLAGVVFETDATETSPVGSYPITARLIGDPAVIANYTVHITDATLTIVPAPVNAWALTSAREYGESNPNELGVFDGIRNGEPVVVAFTVDADERSPVGSYPISAALAGPPAIAANYELHLHMPGELSVTHATILALADPKTRIYGEPNPPLTGTIVGGVKNGDDVQVRWETEATPASPINTPWFEGWYEIYPVLTGDPAVLANYRVDGGGVLTVRRATVEVFAEPKTRGYFTANPPLTGFLRGVKNNDPLVGVFNTAATLTSPAGFYPIFADVVEAPGVPQGSILRNYWVTRWGAGLHVTKAPLTIRADDATRTIGQPNPLFTGTIEGILNNDPVTATYSTFANEFSEPGTFDIMPAAAGPPEVLVSYDITLINGTLTIEAGPAKSYVLLDAPADSDYRDPVTLTATLYGDNPAKSMTGTITFKDGETTLGTAHIEPATVPFFSLDTVAAGPTRQGMFATLLNDDMWVDAVVLARNGRIATFINEAPGFRRGDDLVVGGEPRALFHSDIDGDGGYDDFFTADAGGSVRKLIGRGDGTFETTTTTVGGPLTALAVGSFGNWPDMRWLIGVLEEHADGPQVALLHGNANLEFTVVARYPAPDARWLVNIDGNLVAVGGTTATVFAIGNDGFLTQSAQHVLPHTATTVWPAWQRGLNFNGDFRSDLPIGTDAGKLVILYGTDDRRYRVETVASPVGAISTIEAADIASTGRDDLLVGGRDGDVWMLRNRRDGSFDHVRLATTAPVQELFVFLFTTDFSKLAVPWHSDVLMITGDDPAVASTAELLVGGFGGRATLTTTLRPGTRSLSASYEGNDDFFPGTSPARSHVVHPIAPTIAWPQPPSIVYGTALGAEQLNATADFAGTFEYSPAPGRRLTPGTHDLSVRFMPTEEGSTEGTATTTITVTKAPLTVAAANAERGYWDPAPPYAGTVTGLVPGDDVAVNYSSPASADSPAGTYAIEVALVDPQGRLDYYDLTVTFGTLTVRNPQPVLSSLVPGAAALGSPDRWVELVGEDFVPQSTVRHGSDDLETQFVSRTTLRARVPATLLAARRASSLTVHSSAPGGGSSSPAMFFVNHSGAPAIAVATAAAVNGHAMASLPALTIGGTGEGTLTLARHAANPGPQATFSNTGEYFTLIAAPNAFTAVAIVDCALNGGNRLMWFDGQAWRRAKPQTYDAATGCVTLTLTPATSPAVGALDNVYFAAAADFAPPLTVAAPLVTVVEGATASIGGTIAHVDDGDGAVTASIGTVTRIGSAWAWSFDTVDGPLQNQQVTISGDNGYGSAATVSFDLIVENAAPAVAPIEYESPAIVLAGTPLTFGGRFSDAGVNDSHQVTWAFGDATSQTLDIAAGDPKAFDVTRAYAAAGTFTVTLTVVDSDGGVSSAIQSVVVHTPSAAALALAQIVNALPGVNSGEKNSLMSKLTNAANANQTQAACGMHNAFVNQVRAFERSGRLSPQTATALVDASSSIQRALGCR
jgi:PKD repeat protein